MDGAAMRVRESECSECATGSGEAHGAEVESVDALLASAKDLSERLLRRQQVDQRSEWRVARALSLSLLDALESTKPRR
jgi:hypothetical protein